MHRSWTFRRPLIAIAGVLAVTLAIVLVQRRVDGGAPKPAAKSAKAAPKAAALAPAPRAGEEVATLAGGCFWCVETQYEGMAGIRAVISGYTGGHQAFPKYEEVGSGTTGHYEAVRIYYDPKRITYEKILDVFWHSVDPTQGDGQFCDRGGQYRSAIFHHGEEQRRTAEETRRRLETARALNAPVVTEILPAGPFYVAEEYHQDFWKKDPARYRSYRLGCGRDRQLQKLWGARAAKPTAH